MSEEEAQAAIADFDSAEAIAANIYSLIKEKERQTAQASGQEPQHTRDYDHTASYYTVVDSKTSQDTDNEATAIYDAVAKKTQQKQNQSFADDGATIKLTVSTLSASRMGQPTPIKRAASRIDAELTEDYQMYTTMRRATSLLVA